MRFAPLALPGALFLLLFVPNAKAASGLSLDSALAYTSNADLSENNPVSDRILRVGGSAHFPAPEAVGRFTFRYDDYAKRSENDLLSANFGMTWAGRPPAKRTELDYGVRAILRDYVHDQAGTTDDSFTHYGALGSITSKRILSRDADLELSPSVELEHYPKFANRNDADLAFRIEYARDRAADGLDFSATPGLITSSESDFSKAYLSVAGEYERAVAETSRWGASVSLTPSLYTSRTTGTTSVVLSRNGRKGGNTRTTFEEKEKTVLFTPEIWWTKDLSSAWDFRLDSFVNTQSSKSGTYNFVEFQVSAALRYRVL